MVDINNANQIVAIGQRGDEPWRSIALQPLDDEFDSWMPGTDFDDFREFQKGMAGPGVSLPPRHRNCDSDADGDADLADFQVLQLAFEPEAD